MRELIASASLGFSGIAPALRGGAMAISMLALVAVAGCSGDDDDGDSPRDDGGMDSGGPRDDSGASGEDGGGAGSGERDADVPIDEEDAGSVDEDGGVEPPPEDSAFYPVGDGSRWVYRHTGGSTTWDEEVELEATEYEGGPALMLKDTAGPSGTRSESVLVRDGTQVLRVHREEFSGNTLELTADYDPGFIRFDHAWASRPEGYEETLGYHRIERDAQGRIVADGDRSHRYIVEALTDSVTVPAGEFEDCLRIRRSRVRAAGSQAVEGDEDLFWFCPGIGKVREEDTISGDAEELVSCDIPDGDCP